MASGIEIVHEAQSPRERTVFHVTSSPSILSLVQYTNKVSMNLYAENLFLHMQESDAVRAFLKEKGVDVSGFYMADGSGLSRQNLVTTKMLAQVLVLMKDWDRSWLPAPKSGSMQGVRGLCGYKGSVAFAILVNGALDCEEAQRHIDAFMLMLP